MYESEKCLCCGEIYNECWVPLYAVEYDVENGRIRGTVCDESCLFQLRKKIVGELSKDLPKSSAPICLFDFTQCTNEGNIHFSFRQTAMGSPHINLQLNLNEAERLYKCLQESLQKLRGVDKIRATPVNRES